MREGPGPRSAADSIRRDRRCRDVRRSLQLSLWRSAAGDATEDETARRDVSRAPAERCADLVDRARILGPAGDVDLGVGLSALDAVADLGVQDHARAEIDRVVLLFAARSEERRVGTEA